MIKRTELRYVKHKKDNSRKHLDLKFHILVSMLRPTNLSIIEKRLIENNLSVDR